MKIRFPLYGKIVLWFLLNLVFLGVVFYLFFKVQFRFGLESLLAGRTNDQLQSVSEIIHSRLRQTPPDGWTGLLEEFGGAYQVEFYLFRNDGTQLAGDAISLPPEVASRLNDSRMRPPDRRSIEMRPFDPRRPDARPPFAREFRQRGFRGDEPPAPPPQAGPPPEPRFRASHPKQMIHTTNPSRYWVVVRLPYLARVGAPPFGPPINLLMVSDSIRGAGLFFDYVPWLVVGSAVLAVSVLFWFPLVRGITRSISQMTHATGQIAQGHFDVRVPINRKDELGQLGDSINRMAARLSGFVSGQKRFLGDIAHELCSPIARIQMATGILEQRATEREVAYVNDVREEVQEMSALVNELLSFSKAGLMRGDIQLKRLELAPLVKKIVAREAGASASIDVRVDPGLMVQAEPELLGRAIANLIRNALRYAGHAGPISVTAVRDGAAVVLSVADSGPGVPRETFEQIFDPFFRIESSRSRETGGAGLGLAIVKTCIEACGGSVRASNRSPSGLQVDLTLQSALG